MNQDNPTAHSRRTFLGTAATAAVAAGMGPLSTPAAAQDLVAAPGAPLAPGLTRADRAFKVRLEAAVFQRAQPLPIHRDNGDEALYPTRIGSYSKGLPHNALGEVDAAAYHSLLRAVRSGKAADFEQIVMGGPVLLTNPQCGLAYTLQGPDAGALTLKPAPALASAEQAGEIAENYWMALLRDVHFDDYEGHPLAQAACQDLSALSDFRGPKEAGQVTPATLFRAGIDGDLVGPYVSQFMWQETRFGAETIDRRMRTRAAGVDHLTGYAEWLAVQNGGLSGPGTFDPDLRYVHDGRSLGEWVHIDVLFQAYFDALLILFGHQAPFSPTNPYAGSQTQIAFGTFGPPFMASLLCGVAREALKEVWHQKWFVHRRLRPEAMGGRIHNHKVGAASYPIHSDILGSAALAEVQQRFGSFLLPQAFPEGSPTHPAYGAGHATVAGACVTVLKALFDESFEMPNPVTSSPDGTELVPYSGPPLTVGHELNKLAANVAVGRNIAGVHWRSDAIESLKLGEALAIRYLKDERRTFNEPFQGFRFKKFDGTAVTV